MPVMVRWGVILLVVAVGCGRRRLSFKGCTDDNQCGPGQVCFADGCGDPARGLAVEIQANPAQGQLAQDIPIPEVHQRQNFELALPATLQIDLTRANSAGTPSPFVDRLVSFSAVGESVIIPGIARNFQSSLSSSSGNFSLFLGTGRYTLTVTANDRSIPPLTAQVGLIPGQSIPLSLTFPREAEVYRVRGRVVRTRLPLLPVDTAIPLEIQVLDATMLMPLSQRFDVNPADGTFGPIFADPSVVAATRYALRIRPQDSRALVPEKTFIVPVSPDDPTLEIGNYGQSITFSGRAISSTDVPIFNATVFAQSTVTGGGTFRSVAVRTMPDGSFSLATLLPASDSTTRLWISPPDGSKSALLNTTLSATQLQEARTFRLQDRPSVQGFVHRSDGSEAAGVHVIAIPVPRAINTVPLMNAHTLTDQHGNYILLIDPGLYRLDFIPRDALPRSSRFLEVPTDSAGQQVDIEALVLSKGRPITGTVTLPTQGVASYASVRFFRVVPIGDSLRSIPLAETVTRGLDGTYSVILPTR